MKKYFRRKAASEVEIYARGVETALIQILVEMFWSE